MADSVQIASASERSAISDSVLLCAPLVVAVSASSLRRAGLCLDCLARRWARCGCAGLPAISRHFSLSLRCSAPARTLLATAGKATARRRRGRKNSDSARAHEVSTKRARRSDATTQTWPSRRSRTPHTIVQRNGGGYAQSAQASQGVSTVLVHSDKVVVRRGNAQGEKREQRTAAATHEAKEVGRSSRECVRVSVKHSQTLALAH